MKRLFTVFLTVVMLLGIMAPTASAANKKVNVYVDGDKVSGISAYMDNSNYIWVVGGNSLKKIFPEHKNFIKMSNDVDTLLKDWAYYFGYSIYVDKKDVHLTSIDSSIQPDEDDKVISKPVDKEDDDEITIYKNGIKLKDIKISVDEDNELLVKKNELKKIFGDVAKNVTGTKKVSLEAYADAYGYVYAEKGTRVYLNNDNNVPVQITLNKEVLEFPDQQPIIIQPGRTMVPVALVAEELGFKVEWKAKSGNVKYDMVTIKNDNHFMCLYIGSNVFYLDGLTYKMDVKPFVLNGRTMLPIAFIADAFGLKLSLDSSSDVKVVKLSTK